MALEPTFEADSGKTYPFMFIRTFCKLYFTQLVYVVISWTHGKQNTLEIKPDVEDNPYIPLTQFLFEKAAMYMLQIHVQEIWITT